MITRPDTPVGQKMNDRTLSSIRIRARGDSRPDSDYDLLVVKDTTERTLKLEQRAYRAMLGVLGPADILVETPQRLNALRDATGCVYRDALKEGHVVYERPAA